MAHVRLMVVLDGLTTRRSKMSHWKFWETSGDFASLTARSPPGWVQKVCFRARDLLVIGSECWGLISGFPLSFLVNEVIMSQLTSVDTLVRSGSPTESHDWKIDVIT